jgi:hypothetical protein
MIYPQITPITQRSRAATKSERIRGFAAALAESLWLSVEPVNCLRLCLDGVAADSLKARTERQSLSARSAAKPQSEKPCSKNQKVLV